MNILIVEDDLTNRSLLEKILSEVGTCQTSENGKDALEIFADKFQKEQHIDLICLDILMPEMDGREFLSKLREFEYKRGVSEKDAVKVIMTTALDDSETVLESYKNGCESYIVKPIIKKELLSVINELGFEV